MRMFGGYRKCGASGGKRQSLVGLAGALRNNRRRSLLDCPCSPAPILPAPAGRRYGARPGQSERHPPWTGNAARARPPRPPAQTGSLRAPSPPRTSERAQQGGQHGSASFNASGTLTGHCAQVRKERESPAFVSASAGLGGQAKQQLRGSTSVHAAIRGKGVSLVLGTGARQQSLDGRVGALAEILAAQGIDTDRELTVRLEDAAGPSARSHTCLASLQPGTRTRTSETDWPVTTLCASHRRLRDSTGSFNLLKQAASSPLQPCCDSVPSLTLLTRLHIDSRGPPTSTASNRLSRSSTCVSHQLGCTGKYPSRQVLSGKMGAAAQDQPGGSARHRDNPGED